MGNQSVCQRPFVQKVQHLDEDDIEDSFEGKSAYEKHCGTARPSCSACCRQPNPAQIEVLDHHQEKTNPEDEFSLNLNGGPNPALSDDVIEDILSSDLVKSEPLPLNGAHKKIEIEVPEVTSDDAVPKKKKKQVGIVCENGDVQPARRPSQLDGDTSSRRASLGSLPPSDLNEGSQLPSQSSTPPKRDIKKHRMSSAVVSKEFLLSGSEDGTLKVWDLKSRSLLGRLEGHSGPVLAADVDFSTDRAVSSSNDGSVRVWDIAEMTCLAKFCDHHGAVSALSSDFERQRVLSGSFDKSLKVWDLKHEECKGTLTGHHSPVRAVVADFKLARALSGSDDHIIMVWDLTSLSCIGQLPGHGNSVTGLVVDFEMNKALSSSMDGTLKLWDLTEFGPTSCLCTLEGSRTGNEATCSIPFGKIASQRSSKSKGKPVNGKENSSKKSEASDKKAVAFSVEDDESEDESDNGAGIGSAEIRAKSAGKYQSSSSQNSASSYDLKEGQRRRSDLEVPHKRICALAADFGLQRALSGSIDGSLKVWDLRAYELIGTLADSCEVFDLAADFPNWKAVSCGKDHALKFWDLSDMRLIGMLAGAHDSPVTVVQSGSRLRGNFFVT